MATMDLMDTNLMRDTIHNGSRVLMIPVCWMSF